LIVNPVTKPEGSVDNSRRAFGAAGILPCLQAPVKKKDHEGFQGVTTSKELVSFLLPQVETWGILFP
jgi:hypothetical protein